MPYLKRYSVYSLFKGNAHNKLKCKITCKYCESILEIGPQDAIRETELGGYRFFIQCPVCDSKVEISNEKLNNGEEVGRSNRFAELCGKKVRNS